MVDIELILEQLRSFGHTVSHAYATPSNADDHEFIVDGQTYSLQGVRDLLTLDAESGKTKQPIHP